MYPHPHPQVIEDVRKTHPSLPIILYISGSGGLLERMAAANPDIISIDQSVDIVDGIKRVGSGFAIQVGGALHLARFDPTHVDPPPLTLPPNSPPPTPTAPPRTT